MDDWASGGRNGLGRAWPGHTRHAATINVPIVEKPLLNDTLLDLIGTACATGNLD
jgi:hypothetical protein